MLVLLALALLTLTLLALALLNFALLALLSLLSLALVVLALLVLLAPTLLALALFALLTFALLTLLSLALLSLVLLMLALLVLALLASMQIRSVIGVQCQLVICRGHIRLHKIFLNFDIFEFVTGNFGHFLLEFISHIWTLDTLRHILGPILAIFCLICPFLMAPRLFE